MFRLKRKFSQIVARVERAKKLKLDLQNSSNTETGNDSTSDNESQDSSDDESSDEKDENVSNTRRCYGCCERSEELEYCSDCKKYYCNDCYGECENCRSPQHDWCSCASQCEECELFMCNTLLDDCDNCGTSICEKCTPHHVCKRNE